MPYNDYPLTTLTIPQTAGTGDARMVIGQDVPTDLTTFYQTNGGYSVIGAQLFYTSAGDYAYIAETQDLLVPRPLLVMGVSYAGVVTEKFSFGRDFIALGDLTWEDAFGNGALGGWNLVTLTAGWTNLAGAAQLGVKLVPSPGNTALIYGRVNVPAGAASGATAGTMPNARFIPTKAVQFSCQSWGTVTSINGSVETDGTIKLWGTYSGNVSFNALIPLDGGA